MISLMKCPKLYEIDGLTVLQARNLKSRCQWKILFLMTVRENLPGFRWSAGCPQVLWFVDTPLQSLLHLYLLFSLISFTVFPLRISVIAQVFFCKECIHIELVPHSNFYILYFYTLDYGTLIRYVFQRDCPPALWLALFSHFKMHLFYVYEGLVCLYVGAPCVLYLQRPGDSIGFPRTGVRGGCG